jgi:hypothetical protein
MEISKFLSAYFDYYKKLLSDLSVPDDFLDRLNKDDDWSMVIKIHSLMEIAFTHLLVSHFGIHSKEIFEKLEMGNKQYGKLIFVRKFALISDTLIEFAELLCEMRNSFAHDIRNIDMGIGSYFDEIKGKKPDRYKQWLKVLGMYGLPKISELSDINKIPYDEFVKKIAKIRIIETGVNVLNAIYSKKLQITFEHQKIDAAIKLVEELIKQERSN